MNFSDPFRNPVGAEEIMRYVEQIAWRTEGSRHRKWLIATKQYVQTSKRPRAPKRRESRIAPVEWFVTREVE